MLRCSASAQHGTMDLILFLKDRQADTGERAEIYLPDVPRPPAHTGDISSSSQAGSAAPVSFFFFNPDCLFDLDVPLIQERFYLLHTSSSHYQGRSGCPESQLTAVS